MHWPHSCVRAAGAVMLRICYFIAYLSASCTAASSGVSSGFGPDASSSYKQQGTGAQPTQGLEETSDYAVLHAV